MLSIKNLNLISLQSWTYLQEMPGAILGCGPRNPSITLRNSPFLGYLFPLYQSETWSTTIHRKMVKLNLRVKEISFSYEGMSAETRFQKKARGNSQIANQSFDIHYLLLCRTFPDREVVSLDRRCCIYL